MTTLTNTQSNLVAPKVLPSTANPADEPAAGPLTIVTGSEGQQLLNFRELWQYRELLYFFVWRDVKVRYKQTMLGVGWAVLQPAMMMVVFTVFFGRMAGVPTGDVPYPLFVYAGLLPWIFFSSAVCHAGNSIVASERLVTKVYFPRLAVPFAAIGVSALDFAIAFGLLLVLMVVYGVNPGANLFLVPVVVIAMALLATGLGTLLSALNVAYRDLRYVVPFLLQLWMFATPTIYMAPDAGGSRSAALWMAVNPMTTLVGCFRSAALGGAFPWPAFLCVCAVAAVAVLVGCRYFRRIEDRFADII